MSKDWKIYLDQAHPPGAVVDFSAAAFTLQVAANVRLALKFVELTPECRYHAERVITAAEIYSRAREQGLTLPFSDAEKELAEAVTLLGIELEYCREALRPGQVSLPKRSSVQPQPASLQANRYRSLSL